MSGTSEGAKKAWQTRARHASGSGGGTQLRDDYAVQQQLLAMRRTMGTGADEHNPVTIVGIPLYPASVKPLYPATINEYLARAGAQDWTPAPLPEGMKRGKPHMCYKNASQLVMQDENLDFVEGFGYVPDVPFPIMHAWAVDRRTGKVVDPTWDHPEKNRYYGVRYDRTKYLKYIVKTKMFGVICGDGAAATKVMERGTL